MNNIINMLNSTNNIPNQSGSDSKVKMMAHQYKRFLSKNKNNQSSKYAKCFFTTIRKISQGSTKIWNLLMPITVRGPTTPFQQILQNLHENKFDKSKLPFSHKTVSENIQQGNLTVVLLYKKEKVATTLQKIQRNSGIENLVKSSFQICPISYESEEYSKLYAEKVRQILYNKQCRDQELNFLILWKGLFNQILILDILPLENQYSYFKIMELTDKRQEYEMEIKKLVNAEQDNSYLQANNTAQKLTALTRSSSVSSL